MTHLRVRRAVIITLPRRHALPRPGVDQYPRIAPPTVTVSASYPGASGRGDGGQRRRAAGAADQRRRRHALYVVAVNR